MSEGHRLKEGLVVSVQPPRQDKKTQIGGVVGAISKDSVQVELSQPADQSLKPGEQIRLKYWDEQGVYFSDVEVIGVSGPENQQLETSLPAEAIALQRRASERFRSAIPFTFAVMDAAVSRLISDKVHEAKSLDFSGGGLRFETNLPLKEGDELEIHVGKEKMNLAARIVKTERLSDAAGIGVAVEFFGLEPEDTQRIIQLIVDSRADES